MAQLLLGDNCTVTIAHSRSRDLPAICRRADILVAAYLGYKPRKQRGKGAKPSIKEAAKLNSEALAKMPVRRNIKTLAQMPAFLRTPDQLKMIDDLRAEWKSSG